MPTNRTRGARGGSKLPRTLVSFRHRLAEPRQPRKKNTPCFLDLAGVKFLLKKERVFFFRVLPSKYSGRWRNNADEVLATLFFGERICQNFGSSVFEFGCRKWKRRGLGRNFPFAPLFVLGEFGADDAKKIKVRMKQFYFFRKSAQSAIATKTKKIATSNQFCF